MSFPIHCDNCGADFKLPDSLFEKKVKGKAVTIRCKHCKEEIFVDGTQLATEDAPEPAQPQAATRPTGDDTEPTTLKKAAHEDQPAKAATAKPADETPMSSRDLSVEASLAGVFDDAPAESTLPDDAVESVPEQRNVGEALARKPPGPPRRERKDEPEAVDVDLDEAEFDIDFSSLSAPLDLKAPSLAELTTPPTPSIEEKEPAAGKWVLKPPDASLTTTTESKAKRQPGPLSSVSESIALPLARPKPAGGKRNWVGIGLVMVLAAGAMYGVGYFAGQQGEEAPGAEATGERAGRSAAAAAEPGAAATPAAGDQQPVAGDSESAADTEPGAKGAKPGSRGKRLPGVLPKDPGKEPAGEPAEDKPEADATEKPAEPAPAAAAAAPFNKSAAVSALKSAAASAGSCRRGGDPSGVATVVVTFAPSGRAINANVAGPPFAGTPTGGCIASTMRRARVPPFSGGAQTVSKRVVIR